MNGIPSQEVGAAALNGIKTTAQVGLSTTGTVKSPKRLVNGFHPQIEGLANGSVSTEINSFTSKSFRNGLDELPLEVRQLFEGAFLPLSKLLERYAQECWNGLSTMVAQLAGIPLAAQSHLSDQLGGKQLSNGVSSNDQSRGNLDRKDRLLNFASDQKANFIKLLVLLQWSKDAEAVRASLHLNLWVSQQRQSFLDAAWAFGSMKRQMANAQIPNPDLKSAADVLSLQSVPEFPHLPYIPHKPLTTRQILRTIRSLNQMLCLKLISTRDLPKTLQSFRIHDGRVTFSVPHEFELDLTVVDEDPTSQFYFLAFRFGFSPSSSIPDGAFHSDIRCKADELLRTEGLSGCYMFLHEMVLSYKIHTLYRQALELSKGRYANNLRVELIRRTLVVQYWCNRPAGKSWIEIGVKSRRRKADGLSKDGSDTILDLRWMRENEDVEGPGTQLEIDGLSFSAILGQVLALHVTSIFDLIYDNLHTNPLYTQGGLVIEQTYSVVDPGDCQLMVQLSATRHTALTIEPVTGSAVLNPATTLGAKTQQDVLLSSNLALDLPQRLIYLRCTMAEQELVPAAESAGWDIVRTYRPSPSEAKTLYMEDVLRCVMLRQPHWGSNHSVVATFGVRQDCWWSVERNLDSPTGSPWTSSKLGAEREQNRSTISASHLAALADYVSGLIVLKSNAACMSSSGVRCFLPSASKFTAGYQLPKLYLEFEPHRLRGKPSLLDVESSCQQHDIAPEKDSDRSIWVGKAVTLTYMGVDCKCKRAVVVARARSSAPREVLEQVEAAALDPSFHIHPSKGHILIRLDTVVGVSVVGQLFHQVACVERLIASLVVLRQHRALCVKSLSMSHISVAYATLASYEMGFVAKFESQSFTARLDFWPREKNPLGRIARQLTEIFAEPCRSSPTNLSLVVPLLALTHPLLSCLQKLQDDGNEMRSNGAISHLHGPLAAPRLVIVPRHATMYGIQYFAPAGSASTMPADFEGPPRMLVRLEILPSQRGDQSFWILRPAIEEFESYPRRSFSSVSLQEKIREEIFSKADEQGGWLALGESAICHVDRPGRLLQAVHDLITMWLQDSHVRSSEPIAEIKDERQVADGQTRSEPPIRPQAPRPQKPATNGSAQAKGKQTLVAKGPVQRKPDVIMLDD